MDLRLLDEYRRSFGKAYDNVVRTIRKQLSLQPTGRPAKSTTSIIEKLRRESIRLSQVQDIAGCRLIVANVRAQNRAIQLLHRAFPNSVIVDRRADPSHGYRAVHVVARISEHSIEIQLRTTLQHLWAEFSERLADRVDPGIKYGIGNVQVRQILLQTSEMVTEFEELEEGLKPGILQKNRIDRMKQLKQRIMDHLHRLIFLVDKLD